MALTHVSSEHHPPLLISFLRNPLEFFEGDANTFEFTVNGDIVHRYKTIGIQ